MKFLKLKKNTLIQIINPVTSKVVVTKIFRRANYANIFNIVLSKKIATILELNLDNPFVEVFEFKKRIGKKNSDKQVFNKKN